MSFYVAGRVLVTQTGLVSSAKLVLLGLAEHCHTDGSQARPSVDSLAHYAECSRRQVQRALRLLEAAGWIAETAPATNRRPATYQLAIDRLADPAADKSDATADDARGDDLSPHDSTPRGDGLSPQPVRGDDVSPPAASRGDETSPHGGVSPASPQPARGDICDAQGRHLRRPGATSATSRGDRVSPEPVQNLSGTDPRTVSDPPSDPIAARAGRFCKRYAELHRQHRHGAHYQGRPALDCQEALLLCRTWTDDAHLEAMAVAFLTDDTPHDRFLERGTRSIVKFRSRASAYDEQVRRARALTTPPPAAPRTVWDDVVSRLFWHTTPAPPAPLKAAITAATLVADEGTTLVVEAPAKRLPDLETHRTLIAEVLAALGRPGVSVTYVERRAS